MTTNNMINSSRSYAAIRAQRTQLAKLVDTMQNAIAKAGALEPDLMDSETEIVEIQTEDGKPVWSKSTEDKPNA